MKKLLMTAALACLLATPTAGVAAKWGYKGLCAKTVPTTWHWTDWVACKFLGY